SRARGQTPVPRPWQGATARRMAARPAGTRDVRAEWRLVPILPSRRDRVCRGWGLPPGQGRGQRDVRRTPAGDSHSGPLAREGIAGSLPGLSAAGYSWVDCSTDDEIGKGEWGIPAPAFVNPRAAA